MIQPLPFLNKLAGNPVQDPKYFVEKSLDSGDKLKLADPIATRAMVALMDMNAVLGGAASHYGGPAAFAELLSAVHAYMFHEAKKQNKQWHELYNFVNDAGHCENGIYALKANYGFAGLQINDLKGFRSIDSKLTGHGESHLFPEGVMLSNGPLGSAFPQSQGLAMADALIGKQRVTVTAISDGACMEGEARESMAAIPGLAAGGKIAPYILIISDNNTKLSGRIDKESFSMTPTFSSLKDLGWDLIELNDGHDLQKCLFAFESAVLKARTNPSVPLVIHAKTVKGIGTKKTAESSSGGHGFPLKSASEVPAFIQEIYSGTTIPTEFLAWAEELNEVEKQFKARVVKPTSPEEKIQVGIANAMIKARKAGFPIVSVTSDLPGSTGVAGFRKDFPRDSFDVGIAESNMVSVGAGFSKMGFIPVVDTFAQFGVTKGALPLTMASLSDAAMICVYSHTGFQDAADGASHQALTYFSKTCSIPNVEVYALTCSEEAEALLTQAIETFAEDRKQGRHPKSYVFFLGRENFPKTYVNNTAGAAVTGTTIADAGTSTKLYQLQKAQVLKDNTAALAKRNTGSAVTILAAGSMITEALKASEKLEQESISSIVINPACLNHLDTATIKACLSKTNGNLITIEDHQLIGGFGATVAHNLALDGVSFRMKSLGVHGEFGQSAYNAIELYQKHGMDAENIVKAAHSLLG
jgi:transketolase